MIGGSSDAYRFHGRSGAESKHGKILLLFFKSHSRSDVSRFNKNARRRWGTAKNKSECFYLQKQSLKVALLLERDSTFPVKQGFPKNSAKFSKVEFLWKIILICVTQEISKLIFSEFFWRFFLFWSLSKILIFPYFYVTDSVKSCPEIAYG